jgi:hypothetical protein
VLIVTVAVAAGPTGCTSDGDRAKTQASMSVSPQAALVDEPVAVSVRGLPAEAKTTITAEAVDTTGITWSSLAQFQATPAGEVSLGRPSLGGSYSGVNPMGLFTLMAPPRDSTLEAFVHSAAGYDVTLRAMVDDREVANKTCPGPRVPTSTPSPRACGTTGSPIQ